jgi:hypothetical protein
MLISVMCCRCHAATCAVAKSTVAKGSSVNAAPGHRSLKSLAHIYSTGVRFSRLYCPDRDVRVILVALVWHQGMGGVHR